MTLTLLLDLDDTLLDTNLNVFLPAYFKKLALHLSKKVSPEIFIEAMMRSTQIMYGNMRTDNTLEQVFDQNFYPSLGLQKADISDEINGFYDEIFPTLSSLTAPRPEAISFVKWAFSMGWKVAIATDPLFPRKAILHRLSWAGLDPERNSFSLISDFHNFHFAKISVAYFPEFLGNMNWLDEPVLMVGDSLERDVLPAMAAGIPVFWLNNAGTDKSVTCPQGGYSDLHNYLINADFSQLKVKYDTPKSLIAFLRATPAVVHALSLSLASNMAKTSPGFSEWSFLEIMCHLRDVEMEVNNPRIELIMREENAFIAGQSTDQWAVERNYALQDSKQAIIDFSLARAKLVTILESMDARGWDRSARHTFLGPTSLRELVEIIVDHDRLHMRQAFDAIRRLENNFPEVQV
jgi:FMN phosphatase YigB (HAD superfamily)